MSAEVKGIPSRSPCLIRGLSSFFCYYLSPASLIQSPPLSLLSWNTELCTLSSALRGTERTQATPPFSKELQLLGTLGAPRTPCRKGRVGEVAPIVSITVHFLIFRR